MDADARVLSRVEVVDELGSNDSEMEMEREVYGDEISDKKSRDSRKHGSGKDRKDGRDKGRETLKGREKDVSSKRLSDRHDAREWDQERRKDDKGKEPARGRHRDKERSRDKAREKEKDGGRERDEGGGERVRGRGHERRKDREKDRDKGRDREKAYAKNRDKVRDRETDDYEKEAVDGGWTGIKETIKDEEPANEQKEDVVVTDGIIHEVAVGKGLSGALKLLRDRGTLKERIDWGGRNMDKKKSKLVGINDNDGPKEIRIERTDEFGRVMTPKEAFRMISHKFHGKGPGKMKQEKRKKQYQEDLKAKQMKTSDTPLQAMERMREAQSQLKSPYIVLSGHVKPGQTSDPRSGYATVEKDHPGSVTPMLGHKVEHFLGINRRPDSSNMGPPPTKKPKSNCDSSGELKSHNHVDIHGYNQIFLFMCSNLPSLLISTIQILKGKVKPSAVIIIKLGPLIRGGP